MGYTKIGKYEIMDFCLQSYPCKHYVKVDNICKCMSVSTYIKC